MCRRTVAPNRLRIPRTASHPKEGLQFFSPQPANLTPGEFRYHDKNNSPYGKNKLDHDPLWASEMKQGQLGLDFLLRFICQMKHVRLRLDVPVHK